MREKALGTLKGPTYQLIEVKFGNYPYTVVKGDETIKAGSPISWTADEVRAGQIEALHPDGTPAAIRWEEVAADPG